MAVDDTGRGIGAQGCQGGQEEEEIELHVGWFCGIGLEVWNEEICPRLGGLGFRAGENDVGACIGWDINMETGNQEGEKDVYRSYRPITASGARGAVHSASIIVNYSQI